MTGVRLEVQTSYCGGSGGALSGTQGPFFPTMPEVTGYTWSHKGIKDLRSCQTTEYLHFRGGEREQCCSW